jgi:predicted enzyme related to lactoylglutathione lyase
MTFQEHNMSYFLKLRPKCILAVFAALLLGVTACTTASRPDLTGMSFSSEPLLGKVIWHDLITEDLDSARNFYGELLGWTFEDSIGGRGEEYVIARNGDVIVAGLVLADTPNDNQNYSRWLPYISVDDVDAALSRSIAGGASVVAAARNVGFGRVAAIIDPQGAVVGLARSAIGDPDDVTTAAAPGRAVWTELLANDPQAAAAFYGSLAAYDARTITRRGGEYTVLASDGVDRAGIFQNPSEGEYTPVWITAFGVSDPAAAAAKAESLGGTIILPVSANLRDGTTAVVTDPSGAILVLQSWSRKGAE